MMKNQQKGFSLIELLVSMTIMTFIVALATPSYSAWMANMKIRNQAEGILLGVLKARGEAIKRNQFVTFQLNNDTSWAITDSYNGYVIDKKVASESSKTISLTTNGASKITFNGFGTVSNNVDSSSKLASVAVTSSVSSAGVKPLSVIIGPTGAAIVCDPSVTSASDDRYCRSL